MKPEGHGAWPSSQDHVLVRARVGSGALVSITLEPPTPPAHPRPRSNLTTSVFLFSVLHDASEVTKIGAAEGRDRRNQSPIGAALSLLRTDSGRAASLSSPSASSLRWCTPVPAAAMGPPAAQLNLLG